MSLLELDIIKKSWQKIAQNYLGELAALHHFDIHKKMKNVFHLGKYYYYLLNIPHETMEYVSDSCCLLLGLQKANDFTVAYALNNIHPEDLKRVAFFERRVSEFFNNLNPDLVLKYKVSYDYRIRKSNGEYIWILQQVVPVESNSEGAVLRVIGVHTNITPVKVDNKPSGLSFIALDAGPSYNFAYKSTNMEIVSHMFSKREREVLAWIVKGKKSSEIADILCISLHTVNTHRKRILLKSQCKSTFELALKAFELGWV